MKIIDRFMLGLFSLILAIFSLFIILIPFDINGFLSIENITYIVSGMKNNYYYVLIGIIIFVVCTSFLLSGIIGNKKDNKNSYLAMRNDYGEIIIYSHTIVGLVQNVVDKFSGINNIKTNVYLDEGQIEVEMNGEVSPEINIPEVTKNLQSLVKGHIEDATGAKVKEIKVKINNVTPNKLYK